MSGKFITLPYTTNENEKLFSLTKEIGYVSYVKKHTLLGDIFPRPEIHDFFKFMNIKAYRTGHWVYNHFHFSTQVPAVITYVSLEEISWIDPMWQRHHKINKIHNPKLLEMFNELEYMAWDCLVNFNNIICDGYYDTHEDLIAGIIKMFKTLESQKVHPIDFNKVLTQAKIDNSNLKNFIK